jgi:hypothetical protein
MRDRGKRFGKDPSRRRGRTTIACFVSLVIAASSRSASATNNCDGVHLDLSDDLSPAWQEAGARLRAELVASDAACVNATLTIEPAPGGARLTATSADGSRTTRLLTRTASLVPTALGIVASLPPDTGSKQGASDASPSADDAHEETTPTEYVQTIPIDPAPQLWLGASAGARLGGPTWLGMLDIEGHLGFESRRWLVVASLRYGTSMGESGVSTDDTYYEIVGALGVGRRFSLGSTTLDLVLSPALASASLNDNDDEVGPTVGARTEARLGASVCWWTQFSDGSRINLTADTDVAPYGFFQGVRTSETEPVLPVWTLGLRLGAAGRIF